MTCPFSADLFEGLSIDFEEAAETGEFKELVELVIEQLASNVFEKHIYGVKLPAREQLQRILRRHDFTTEPLLKEAVSATIAVAKEVDAQSYVYLEGFAEEYYLPWLQSLAEWLYDNHDNCDCTDAIADYLAMF